MNNRHTRAFNMHLLKWLHYGFTPDYFIVKNWKVDQIGSFLSKERMAFYKMLHVTSGKGILGAGLNSYLLSAGDVAFVPPDESISWQPLTVHLEGHFCFVHPKFFKHASHVSELFMSFPHAQPSRPVVPLDQTQSANVQHSFELMRLEAVGHFKDKKQAILIHLQMILLKVRRAGKPLLWPHTTG